MTVTQFIDISQKAIWVAIELGAPMLLVSLVVGLAVSVMQAVTQLNEATLSFIPKVVAMIITMVLLGPWMLQRILNYTATIINSLPETIG